ncbi:Uncharacterised protein [Achromobacter sp. 2789STDY5608615]|uniref:hypothetical protein n=1 Tax=Achromobacter TaxID=222 RepID=UPI0006C0550D|nr:MULTISPECIES: hypothetical protein [Achromobacter]CAB3845373.1 hypothetical protein LMG26846_01697 [Achromobacter insuavis]CUJ83060.1 Uncharacterised protein [Achromobacter sp. 2789STDY5608615]
MFATKQIIVVYPANYEDLAITLQHELTKVDGLDSAAWTVEHYQQSAPALSGRSFVIFIGNSEENRYSKFYLESMPKIVNLKGACFTRDGSKAIVFGEGQIEQRAAFEKLKSELGYGPRVGGIIGAAVGSGFLTAAPLAVGGVFGVLGFLGYRAAKYFKGESDAKKLRHEQTKLAIYSFLLTELDDWLGAPEQ